MNTIQIAGKSIGKNEAPFIVAELSGNHQQNYDLAEQMIVAAAEAGVDAIKLQTYTADTMTLNVAHDDFQVDDAASLWQGSHLYQLYTQAATPWSWHQALFAKAQSLGLIAFSSPFDETAVDFLESLNVPCYKIASFENTDLPLIKKVAQTGKPIIISTGMASIEEINEALETVYATGNKQVILLKCTSNYPADSSDAHLQTLVDMQQRFNCLVGLSDHTLGINVSLSAVALGACFIEKHLVLDRTLGAVDAEFSLQADEFSRLVQAANQVKTTLGQVQYGGSENEQSSKKYRRSVYCYQTIKQGEILTKDNIKIIRPGYGLAPKFFAQILGKKASIDLPIGQAIHWNHIES